MHKQLFARNTLAFYTGAWWYAPPHGELRGELDPIDPAVVGAFDYEKLASFAQWDFIKEPLNRILRDGPWPENTLDPETPRPVPYYATRARSIAESLRNRLLTGVEAGLAKAYAGLFTVPKVGKGDRAIFDCRPGNQLLERTHKLVLFQIEDVLVSICRLFAWDRPRTGRRKRGGGGYAFSMDLRHWFYQWKIGSALGRFFMIKANGELMPRVMPMGFHNAPAWAQSGSWGLALHREPGESPLGIRDEHLARVAPLESGPPFLTLFDGDSEVGRLFVLLDGIAVITSSHDLGRAWKARLQRNCHLFGAVVKEHSELEGKRSEEGSEQPTIAFSGVEVREDGAWRAAREPKPLTLDEMSSLRAWAQGLGQCFWSGRVHQQPSIAETRLRIIAGAVGTAAQGASEGEDLWDKQCTLPSEFRESLNRSCAEARTRPWTRQLKLLRAPRDAEALFVAADATETRIAYVVFNAQGAVAEVGSEDMPAGPMVVREAQALELGVRQATRLCRNPENTVIFIGCDNEGVRHSVNNRWSRNEQVREQIALLGTLDVTAVRIPTEINVADAPSRHAEVDEEARLATWALLKQAETEWRNKW